MQEMQDGIHVLWDGLHMECSKVLRIILSVQAYESVNKRWRSARGSSPVGTGLVRLPD